MRQTQVPSGVLAATVGESINLDNLKENVTISFKPMMEGTVSDKKATVINQYNRAINFLLKFTAPGSERCVYWDFGTLNWTTSGCSKAIAEDGIIICHCNHLTNFAVLVVKFFFLI